MIFAFFNSIGQTRHFALQKTASLFADHQMRKSHHRPTCCHCRLIREFARLKSRLQPRQFPTHAGDAGTDQGLVAVEPEKEKLIKIGAKVISHGRTVAFQMAEVAIPRQMFQEIF